MGLGIGVMHYTGMEAMRLSALLRYDLPIFIAAILVAFLLATAAFWTDDELRHVVHRGGRRGGRLSRSHLRRAQSDLERLRGILHICSWCKRIPEDGAWYDLEAYISRREEASFSHGICPQCSATEFGTLPGRRTL